MPSFVPSINQPIQLQVEFWLPVPDERIVQRLIGYYTPNRFALRNPLEVAPADYYLPMDKIKFHARVLTLLARLGIYPPPVLLSAGPKPIRLPGSWEGPIELTPPGAQTRFLNHARTEDEAKQNAVSSKPGSLADGAEGMCPIENEVKQIEEVHRLTLENNRLRNELLNRNADFVEPRLQIQHEIDGLTDEDLDEFLNDAGQVTPVQLEQDVQALRIIRPVERWSNWIRRRLPWTRLSEEKKREIELERLRLPAFQIDDPDEEDDEEEPIGVSDEEEKWIQTTPPPERRRIYKYWYLLGVWLLVPISIVAGSGVLIPKLQGSQLPDPLVQMYYKLPAKHWFRLNFTIGQWALIVSLDNRTELYLFIGLLISNVLYFTQDVHMLWRITKNIADKDTRSALNRFIILRKSIKFRSSNMDLLLPFEQVKLSLSWYAWCYVLEQMNNEDRVICDSWVNSGKITTQQIVSACQQAKIDVDREGPTLERKSTFAYVAASMVSTMQHEDYTNPWIEAMTQMASRCFFVNSYSNLDKFFVDLCLHPGEYPADSKEQVEDFFKRYNGKAGMNPESPWRELSNDIANNLFLHQHDRVLDAYRRTLEEMKRYFNRDSLDQLAYDILNERFARHHSPKEWGSFQEAFDHLGLRANFPLEAIFELASAAKDGFIQDSLKTQKEVIDANDPPETIGLLHNQGPLENDNFLPHQDDLVDHLLPRHRHIGRGLLDGDLYIALHAALSGILFSRTSQMVFMEVGEWLLIGVRGYIGGKYVMNFLQIGPTQENSSQVIAYSKELTQTSLGWVLSDTNWTRVTYEIALGTGVALLVANADKFSIGWPIVYRGLDLSRQLYDKFAASSLKNQLLLGTAGAVTLYYGPKKIIDTTVEVVKGVTSVGPAIVAAGLITAGVYFGAPLLAQVTKRQRVK